MLLKDFKLVVILVLFSSITAWAQQSISGIVTHSETNLPIENVEVFDKDSGMQAKTDATGFYQFETSKTKISLVFFSYEFDVYEISADLNAVNKIDAQLTPLSVALSEVELFARKTQVFELSRLKDVEGTAIFAGKKTEVVLVDQSMANLASNNARQIYSQVVGLNIYQNDDAGLQLNIGGRGLDPNRTSNFNTRQNGYDISADVLGYPESYYTPAAEGLGEIQIVRGAASLQFGTQFGGLVNFKMKKPNPDKALELITRNTLGSFGLYTNFTSLSGTKNNWSYYAYFNYKKGDGFRPNSEFESKNAFAHLGYKISENTSISGEITYMRYLAQQAGGLTDTMFYQDPYQSNRERNWFQIDWLLYNVKFEHQFSETSDFSFSFFGLQASRSALGFRTNRVDQIDSMNERDLIKGDFKNFGFETRYLNKYTVLKKDATFLIGAKYYNAHNDQQQGPGSANKNPDFNFYTDDYPNYANQSNYDLPNLNVAIFGENIFYLTDKFSVTPGARFEYIKTQSDGYYKEVRTDGAGNPIFDETVYEDASFDRSFVLLGIGLSYKANSSFEMYGNISQNYRSVTFSDISIINPAFSIDPNITDEDGFTSDLGIRGNFNGLVSYDANVFGLFYNNRIGFVPDVLPGNRIISKRTNVGDAAMYGIESLFDVNIKKIIGLSSDFSLNYFVNSSFITSEYTDSDTVGIKGNKVEFVPEVNIKTGLKFGYKNLLGSVQYTYLSSQFTDASNSVQSGISGVIGQITSYDILDFSLSYSYKRFKLEAGVNNALDNSYFTRRATGYPGPGIIPSAPRNWYTTLQIKI
ncbi:TonB-dependent receptor [Bizionia myxarmorum]|uniref:TonB-dependent receptor n=1 Tax=Bizionia myxarmorum TaxID=291186 RepID=A0A5D0R983_9FLAO|nr:TonB-dependent receptor [Bizionia myxarmorum]TYB77248.1 TonB-dependent receptor [Bizionia myxarmorum]